MNLKHASTYIAKTLMGVIAATEARKTVDWADILARSLEKELKHIDLQKGQTRIAPHLYILLGLDTAQEYPVLTPVDSHTPLRLPTPKKRARSIIEGLRPTRSSKPKIGVQRHVPSKEKEGEPNNPVETVNPEPTPVINIEEEVIEKVESRVISRVLHTLEPKGKKVTFPVADRVAKKMIREEELVKPGPEPNVGSLDTGPGAKGETTIKATMVPNNPMETMAIIVDLERAKNFLVATSIEIGAWRDRHKMAQEQLLQQKIQMEVAQHEALAQQNVRKEKEMEVARLNEALAKSQSESGLLVEGLAQAQKDKEEALVLLEAAKVVAVASKARYKEARAMT